MGLKQELEAARTAVGAALHNVNTVLTELGLEPAATVAALPACITAAHAAGEAAGRQAEYDFFWNAHQNYGRKFNYSSAFMGVGWTDETFKPKYDIAPTQANYMFAECGIVDLTGALEKCGVTLDFSKCMSSQFLTSNGSKIKHFPPVDLSSTDSFTNGFSDGRELVEGKLIGSKTITNWSNAFKNCANLTNLTIEVVINGAFDVTGSPKLTHESLLSILGALKDRSTSAPLVCALGATNLAKLSDAEKAIATGKGWTLV